MVPFQSPWQDFIVFFSASYTQGYLKKCYQEKALPNSESKCYDNCYPFIYYIEHAQNYYDQAKIAPLTIKPNLLFYGFGQLIKACLLTVDCSYPESTSVLAHGVSARKRKKQQYEFLYDEIKIQKNGLLTHFAERMFHMKHLEGEKVIMRDLLLEIPELSHLFYSYFKEESFLPLSRQQETYSLSKDILSRYHMGSDRFHEYIQQKSKTELNVKEHENKLEISFNQPAISDKGVFRLNIADSQLAVSLNKDSKCFSFPEILVHYLLLYNLSMIARYETEWWLELLKTTPNSDFAFIKSFLHTTEEKSPLLIMNWLREAHPYA
ncbi:YaaC family protein [Peribacillus kribbensis]|uniref:YaaC family protein n=1 Tax=Peribacillus kribbensis TaxID=356658 RepID=UPI0004127B03|nr:YaaC family protein [Peribacillus kribbensis]